MIRVEEERADSPSARFPETGRASKALLLLRHVIRVVSGSASGQVETHARSDGWILTSRLMTAGSGSLQSVLCTCPEMKGEPANQDADLQKSPPCVLEVGMQTLKMLDDVWTLGFQCKQKRAHDLICSLLWLPCTLRRSQVPDPDYSNLTPNLKTGHASLDFSVS